MENILIREINGVDIFEAGVDIMLHQTNCKGVMGAGIALDVKNRFPDVYSFYHAVCERDSKRQSVIGGHPLFGTTLLVSTESAKQNEPVIIGNVFAQDGYSRVYRMTNYEALIEALDDLIFQIRDNLDCAALIKAKENRKLKIGIPYMMGCNNAGGNWNIYKTILEEHLAKPLADIAEVTIYNKQPVSKMYRHPALFPKEGLFD